MAAIACTSAAAGASALVASTSACSSSASSVMGTRVAMAPLRVSRVACRGLVAVSASAAAVEKQAEEKTVQRLLGIYQEKVVPALQEEFKYENKFEVSIHLSRILFLFFSVFFNVSNVAFSS